MTIYLSGRGIEGWCLAPYIRDYKIADACATSGACVACVLSHSGASDYPAGPTGWFATSEEQIGFYRSLLSIIKLDPDLLMRALPPSWVLVAVDVGTGDLFHFSAEKTPEFPLCRVMASCTAWPGLSMPVGGLADAEFFFSHSELRPAHARIALRSVSRKGPTGGFHPLTSIMVRTCYDQGDEGYHPRGITLVTCSASHFTDHHVAQPFSTPMAEVAAICSLYLAVASIHLPE